jgi:hypothetical protein
VDNPEKLTTQDTKRRTTNQKHNMCSTPPHASKHNQHKQDLMPPTNKTLSFLQTTGGKDEQTRHDPSYIQLEIKTNKQDMIPPIYNWK